jgi:hypothetical protein
MLEVKLDVSCGDFCGEVVVDFDDDRLLWETSVDAANQLYRPSLVYDLAGCPMLDRYVEAGYDYTEELDNFFEFRDLMRGPLFLGRAWRELWQRR